MPSPDDVLEQIATAPTLFIFWCPGCESAHQLETKPGAWTWNGDLVRPTASPSLAVRPHAGGQVACHFWIRDGALEFLNDCGHKLAGQTVPMVTMDSIQPP